MVHLVSLPNTSTPSEEPSQSSLPSSKRKHTHVSGDEESRAQPPNKRSWVWTHFKVEEAGNTSSRSKAICQVPSRTSGRVCGADFVLDKKGSTRSYLRHLVTIHGFDTSGAPPGQETRVDNFFPRDTTSRKELDQESMRSHLARFIIQQNLPFSTVDSSALRELLTLCHARAYNLIPSRTIIIEQISSQFRSEKARLI